MVLMYGVAVCVYRRYAGRGHSLSRGAWYKIYNSHGEFQNRYVALELVYWEKVYYTPHTSLCAPENVVAEIVRCRTISCKWGKP